MRGENLRAVDAVTVAIWRGAGLEVGDRRAGVGLGHAHGNNRFSGEQAAQEFFLLRGGPIFGQHPDRAEVAGLDHISAARAHRGDGLDRQHGVHQIAALPAIGLADGDAEQALLRHQLGDIPGVFGLMRPRQRSRGQIRG
jgi:hypothetical protein